MNVQRLRELRSRQSHKVAALCRQRDGEIRRYGMARERTGTALVLADAELQEIERELAEAGRAARGVPA